MSYSIWVSIDTGNGSGLSEYVGDPTYNLSPMFEEALGCPMRDLDGRSCQDAADVLRRAVEAMEAEPERFKRHDSPNGWGTYEGAVKFMNKFKNICVEHPLAKVSVA